MACAAQTNWEGFQCPVRGCPKRRNRFFQELGLAMHLIHCHPGELEKRLKLRRHRRTLRTRFDKRNQVGE
jgi:hypothetical protein